MLSSTDLILFKAFILFKSEFVIIDKFVKEDETFSKPSKLISSGLCETVNRLLIVSKLFKSEKSTNPIS